MRHSLIRFAFRMLGVDKLYENIVIQDRLQNTKSQIRKDLEDLLSEVNRNNPYFEQRFTSFLNENRNVDDETFFSAYARLPVFSKQDYSQAGDSILNREVARRLKSGKLQTLEFDGKPISFLKRLRRGDFLMPMATGGSTSLPLTVHMTKHHMFSMLFTFFKCWYRQGWRPGDRMLVFYPSHTYNIDDLAHYNRFSGITGFQIHLFDKIDESTIRDLVRHINRFKPKMLLVFPSPLNMVAETIRKQNLQLIHHPELINVSGETFFDCQRKNIQDVFTGSKIQDSYGSVELGEIAHETDDGSGLEIFANVAYVETAPNEDGKPEMICTRLNLSDFPFIRYKMKDIAEIEFLVDRRRNERFAIGSIEGKDSNFILSHSGERLYPSFFNELVNELNSEFSDAIVEIKIYERGQRELEVQYIVRTDEQNDLIADATRRLLSDRLGSQMTYLVKFVDYIDHDYRRKYRVIERIGDVEYAGGVIGNQEKLNGISDQAPAIVESPAAHPKALSS